MYRPGSASSSASPPGSSSGLRAGSEDLPAEAGLVDDDRGVVQRVLRHETVQRPVDDGQAGLIGGEIGHQLSPQVRHVGLLVAQRSHFGRSVVRVL